jgi:hypothetical protein
MLRAGRVAMQLIATPFDTRGTTPEAHWGASFVWLSRSPQHGPRAQLDPRIGGLGTRSSAQWSRSETAGTKRQKILRTASFPPTSLLFRPATLRGKQEQRGEETSEDIGDTRGVSRGRKQGHPRKHPTLARTYQEHNPSKPAVDARGVPSIEQLAHLGGKTGDK